MLAPLSRSASRSGSRSRSASGRENSIGKMAKQLSGFLGFKNEGDEQGEVIGTMLFDVEVVPTHPCLPPLASLNEPMLLGSSAGQRKMRIFLIFAPTESLAVGGTPEGVRANGRVASPLWRGASEFC